MSDLLLYLIKANVALALSYLGYHFLLRKLTFYGINRIYLIFALVFSAVYPITPFNQWFVSSPDLSSPLLPTIIDWPQLQMPEEATSAYRGFSLFYWLSVGLFFLLLLIKLMGLGRIHFKSVPARWNRFAYRKSREKISPFSFMTHIYFNPTMYAEDEYEKIFSHEQVHVRQLHSLDVLLAEAALIFFWYNPFCWLIRKAVQENIEFITDQRVLSLGIDKKSYQYSLLQISTLSHPSYLGNHFNLKNLKKRIIMMNKKQSSKMHLGKYVFILPAVILGSLILGVSKANEQEGIQEKFQQNIKTNLPEPAAAVEEKEEVIVQSLQQDAHKAVVGPSALQDTLMSNEHLYVVDGKKQHSMEGVKAETVESINVIKGDGATNLYGDEGKHGVILVTTKKASQDPVVHEVSRPDNKISVRISTDSLQLSA